MQGRVRLPARRRHQRTAPYLAPLLLAAGQAWCHTGAPGAPQGLASAWTLDPLVLVPLALVAALYLGGVRAAWRRAGLGRGVGPAEAASFAGGMAALFLALVWPLDVLGEALFSAHMAQHLLLMNLAAPLVVLGAPLPALLWSLPPGGRRAIGAMTRRRLWRGGWRLLTGIAVATVLQQVVLWAWHTPGGVTLALRSEPAHVAMHASLMAAALLFWRAVLHPRAGREWAAVAALAVTLKLNGTVCILLLLQSGVHYPAYGDSAAAWGLSATEDEQIGWGLMMTAGTASYLVAAITLVARTLPRSDQPDPTT